MWLRFVTTVTSNHVIPLDFLAFPRVLKFLRLCTELRMSQITNYYTLDPDFSREAFHRSCCLEKLDFPLYCFLRVYHEIECKNVNRVRSRKYSEEDEATRVWDCDKRYAYIFDFERKCGRWRGLWGLLLGFIRCVFICLVTDSVSLMHLLD